MIIKNDETKIIGDWQFDGKNVFKDGDCNRIEWLTSGYLQRIAFDDSGWDILYQDPTDKRFWELTYPQSNMHGGGPPSLSTITYESAKNKYPIK